LPAAEPLPVPLPAPLLCGLARTRRRSFSPYSTQLHVFESLASPVVDEVLLGYNCTIFA
jgi:hypothetical protein